MPSSFRVQCPRGQELTVILACREEVEDPSAWQAGGAFEHVALVVNSVGKHEKAYKYPDVAATQAVHNVPVRWVNGRNDALDIAAASLASAMEKKCDDGKPFAVLCHSTRASTGRRRWWWRSFAARSTPIQMSLCE